MEELQIQFLRDKLTGEELAAAASKLAQETAGMGAKEKAAFARGVQIACAGAIALTRLDIVTARVLSALIVATFDLQREQSQES